MIPVASKKRTSSSRAADSSAHRSCWKCIQREISELEEAKNVRKVLSITVHHGCLAGQVNNGVHYRMATRKEQVVPPGDRRDRSLRMLLYPNPDLIGVDICYSDDEDEVDWTAVHARICSHPHETWFLDGDAALHHIIKKAGHELGCDPTIALVDDAVEAYPEALVEESSRLGTPLCIAIDKDRMDIFRLLLGKMADFPDGVLMKGSFENTPYHTAKSFEQLDLLVKHNPKGLCKRNKTGMIPLRYYVDRCRYSFFEEIDLRMFRLLLDCGWERNELWSSFEHPSRAGILVPDWDGMTALAHATFNWGDFFKEFKLPFDDDYIKLAENHRFQVMRYLCSVAYSEKLGLREIDYDAPLLCSLLSLVDYLEPRWVGKLVSDILVMHPDEAWAVDHNTGRTPLHMLASCDRLDVPSKSKIILQYPGVKQCASTVDNKGMLPLQLGAMSGLEWQCMKKIADANKRAVRTRHSKTGLLPFHLAAVKGKSFDSAYNLLREVADFGTPNSPTLISTLGEVKMGSAATTTWYRENKSVPRQEAKRRRTTPA